MAPVSEQPEIWPDQEPEMWDVVTMTPSGGVVWKNYRGKIVVTHGDETPDKSQP
jgi:hypothetical protein